MLELLTRVYVVFVALVSLATLAYVYIFPPVSMQTTRDGVPFFTPPVENPETGEPLDLGELVRHYRGD
jgi:hypothetical protein